MYTLSSNLVGTTSDIHDTVVGASYLTGVWYIVGDSNIVDDVYC